VVDGGALQEVDPKLLTANMIVTPNKREQEILEKKLPEIPPSSFCLRSK
jgi:hypothetical protein